MPHQQARRRPTSRWPLERGRLGRALLAKQSSVIAFQRFVDAEQASKVPLAPGQLKRGLTE
jgi:hypothetical protein